MRMNFVAEIQILSSWIVPENHIADPTTNLLVTRS